MTMNNRIYAAALVILAGFAPVPSQAEMFNAEDQAELYAFYEAQGIEPGIPAGQSKTAVTIEADTYCIDLGEFVVYTAHCVDGRPTESGLSN
jgi:hypothetical protein